jgi:hypothetical protein
MTVKVKLTVKGPLVEGKARPEIRAAVEAAVAELTEIGHERISLMARPRPAGVFKSLAEAGAAVSKGYYRANIHRESHGMTGVIGDSGVIYGPWLEGTGSRNASTRFKGYAMFRRTAQFLESRKQRVLDAHIKSAVQKLGGA